jgi:hypothetical protein
MDGKQSEGLTADLPKREGDAATGAARSDEVVARTHLGTGNRKNPIKLLANLTGQTLVFAEGGEEDAPRATVLLSLAVFSHQPLSPTACCICATVATATLRCRCTAPR